MQFSPAKDPIKRMKQATVWEKILASHISEKGLVPKIKKNSKSSKVKKQYNYQMGKRHAQTFH